MSPYGIRVGTCGFPAARKKVFFLMDVVELQSTFYDLLTEKQIEGIRKDKPPGKEVTVKAWFVITHHHTSPLWRRLRSKVPGDPESYGWLRPSRENLSVFDKIVDESREIGASVIVFQTPSSMPVSREMSSNIKRFFEITVSSTEEEIRLAWEPRGPWKDMTSFLRELTVIGITIVTDYLRTGLPPLGDLAYTRLHGLGGRGEVNYKYKYTHSDLEKLYKLVIEAIDKGARKAYVLFNNVYMLQDALAFKSMITKAVAEDEKQ